MHSNSSSSESRPDFAAKNEVLMQAYRVCFGSPAGQIVLTDLVKYCCGVKTTFVPGDSRASDALQGRREVLLRIQGFTKLSEDDFLHLFFNRIRPRVGEAE